MIDRLDIHAYADRELAPEEMARAEQEIAASPEASRELEAIQGLKSCLHTKLEQPEAAGVWRVCVDRLDELDRVKKAETFVGKYAWALSGLLFIVIFAGGMLNRSRGGSVGVGDVASFSSGMTPLSSPGLSQPEQLKGWITEQTGHRPMLRIEPSSVAQISFADRPEGRIVDFTMRDSKGLLDVVIIPNVTRVDGVQEMGGDMYKGQVNGRNLVTWPDAGCAVVVIGDRDPEQLRAFAQSLYK